MPENLPTVFVVDDEQLIADTLTLILQKNGFSARAFTDPREALRAALIERPALLVSDVLMAELSGVDLAIAIRQMCPDCKVLLISGHAETTGYLDRARERGHDFYLLSKPVHPTVLLEHIRQQDHTWVLSTTR